MAHKAVRKQRTLVGLDIQSSSIAAIDLGQDRKSLKKFAFTEMQPGLVSSGEYVDPDQLGNSIKEFFSQNSLNKHVRIGVANHRVIVRVIEIPSLDNKDELDAAVRFSAAEHLPMPIDQAVIDYQVIEHHKQNGGVAKDRVVVVAAPREMIERMIAVIRKAGLKLEGIDLSAFALIRAMHSGGKISSETVEEDLAEEGGDENTPPSAVAYCHLGSVTTLAVAEQEKCLFARTLSYSFDSIATELADLRQISQHDAISWLSYVGISKDTSLLEGDPSMISDTRELLEQGATHLADELQASFDFYHSQPGFTSIDRVVLSGPGTTVAGLTDDIGSYINREIEVRTPDLGQTAIEGDENLVLAYGLAFDGGRT